jgi:pimeloyl-ACP methyl ester carboxylesterase
LIDKVVIYHQPHVMDAAGNRHYTIRAIPYEDSEMEAARLKVLHEARVMFPWSDQEEGHRDRMPPPCMRPITANLNPWTEAKVDTDNPERGPLLIISGEKDHIVPPAIANASYKQQQDNQGVTEIIEIKNRGHALTIDSGWREVADTALAFVKRFT